MEASRRGMPPLRGFGHFPQSTSGGHRPIGWSHWLNYVAPAGAGLHEVVLRHSNRLLAAHDDRDLIALGVVPHLIHERTDQQ